jgi:hypothetical protein
VGYFFRFFAADAQGLDFLSVQTALRKLDPQYRLEIDELRELAVLSYGEQRLALVEINGQDDDIFQDDLAEFRDLVGDGNSPAENRVREVLQTTQTIVAVEAQWEGEDAEPVLSRIDVLWEWLFTSRKGLLQADGEGFYDADGLILKRHFTL